MLLENESSLVLYKPTIFLWSCEWVLG